jgi:predicted nuclease with TOPRIM domain
MALQSKLDEWKTEKGELDAELEMTHKKLTRARQLIEGLGNERSRWAGVVKDLEQLYIKSTGKKQMKKKIFTSQTI